MTQNALDPIIASASDDGELRMIVRRPGIDEREVLTEAVLDVSDGLLGDTWKQRPSSRMPDKSSPHPDMQLNIMNARAAQLIAGDESRWPLAGDQLFVDLDLSGANLPPGTRLEIGDAIVEVTPQPHTGCAKFSARFGSDMLRLVNSPEGRSLNLRGICARVVQGGTIRKGDAVRKVAPIRSS